MVIGALGFVAVGAKVIVLQTANHERLHEAGVAQRLRTESLDAPRGRILDRNGAQLAITVPAPTIVADPEKMTDPVSAAAQLAPIVGVDESVLRERFAQPGSRFAYVARQVDENIAARVRALSIPGVLFQTEPRRFYPAGDLAAPLLGTVGIDDSVKDGKTGMEYLLDDTLGGHAGSKREERDQLGNRIPETQQHIVAATPGKDVLLTIDAGIQYEAESVLAEEVDRVNADGGMAVVMDVRTGEILAAATVTMSESGTAMGARAIDKNRPFTDVYEPGSTNKVITMAAAMDAGLVNSSTSIDVPLSITRANATTRDEHRTKAGPMTVTEILRDSSNVGTIKLAEMLGSQPFDAALRNFGFGRTTPVDFPGEASGVMLAPEDYSDTSMITIPIGYGVAVTPIQMLNVFATIAREGSAPTPHLVFGTDEGNGIEIPERPVNGAQVVRPETARSLTAMLETVVESGTGTKAQIPGYTVAGKTGTARKAPYSEGIFMSSFAGFAPASAPELAAIVVVDNPKREYYGGDVAAPAFQRVMAYALEARKVGSDAPIVVED